MLFTSGYTENAIMHHGRLDSGVLLLAKPYRKSEMARMIRTALAGQSIRRRDVSRDRERCGNCRAGTRFAAQDGARRGHHDPHQIGRVPGAELLHDVGAVIFDRARADSELAPGFLVGGARGELLQHLAFAPRSAARAREMQRRDVRRRLRACRRA